MAISSAEETIHRSAQAARAAMAVDTGIGDQTGQQPQPVRRVQQNDDFLDHYFKRIDPKVAASFTADQCDAIKTMFGARGYNQHAIDWRPTFWFVGKRRYLVVLSGCEKRSFGRFGQTGSASLVLTLLVHFGFVLMLLLPVFGIVYGLKTFGGIDFLAIGNVAPKLSLLRDLALAHFA